MERTSILAHSNKLLLPSQTQLLANYNQEPNCSRCSHYKSELKQLKQLMQKLQNQAKSFENRLIEQQSQEYFQMHEKELEKIREDYVKMKNKLNSLAGQNQKLQDQNDILVRENKSLKNQLHNFKEEYQRSKITIEEYRNKIQKEQSEKAFKENNNKIGKLIKNKSTLCFSQSSMITQDKSSTSNFNYGHESSRQQYELYKQMMRRRETIQKIRHYNINKLEDLLSEL